ncbi:hypothetical protein SGCOL_010386 [Colletotrichum sp. CLE4]
MSQSAISPTLERTRTSEVQAGRAIAPESALSSSETFGSEIKTLLVSRSNPGSAASPTSTINAVTPLPHIDRCAIEIAIGNQWPTEEEAHAMLDVVVFNVGISQQLFDSNTALRLAISHGGYALQEDFPCFPSATALGVNVLAARITGKITATIYSQRGDPEATFINNVQDILHSLYEVEKTMPSEYSMEIKHSGLIVAGRPFMEAAITESRTSSSLHISVYSAVIHTVRPILLYMARNSRDPERNGSHSDVSPALVRLAEICIETASKTLVILQELQKREILAKNAFLDLDATFSVGFVFVLVEAINPGNILGHKGIDGSRVILRYLVALGNRPAASRLAELDQMCTHLALPVHQSGGQTPHPSFIDLLTQKFSFSSGYGNFDVALEGPLAIDGPAIPSAQGLSDGQENAELVAGVHDIDGQHDFGFSGADLASIPLEGEDSLYWVYHTPGFSFTGVEQTDWEALENQIPWGSQQ